MASRSPSVIGVAVVPTLVGLDSEKTAVPDVPELVLETSVNEAPGMPDMAVLCATPVILSSAGLYFRVKLPDVTPSPLLSAIGMPALGMVLAALILARETEMLVVLETNN